jgi:hypothetical protein
MTVRNQRFLKRGIKMQVNQEIKMFGCTEQNLDKYFDATYNINMHLAGLLSDAQELYAMGKKEQGDQILNQVKYYFFEYTDTRNETNLQKLS